MKVLNLLLFYLYFKQFLIVNALYGDSNPTTLIVNPNIKNTNYTVGELCGTENSTCNSISDAISFFNTIAVVENPTTIPHMYQPLNLLLDDGVYGLNESSVQLFQYNINISPLNTATQQQVIFDGQVNFVNQTLFKFNVPDDIIPTNISTMVTISGITFRNFVYSIVDVATQNSLTNVTFNNCYFENFISTINPIVPTTCIPMIKFYQNTDQVINSFLIITNSFIQNSMNPKQSNTNPYFINLSSANVVVSNLNVNSVSGFESIINGDYFSRMYIDSSLFQSVNTSYGSVSITMGSNLTMTNTVFNGCYSLYGGVDIYLTSSATIGSAFFINGCTFTNGYSKNGCGAIAGTSLLSSGLVYPTSFITNSTFSYNYGSMGGAIAVAGMPVEIINSNFIVNSAGYGGTFQISRGSILEVKYSTIISDATSSNTIKLYGGSIAAHDSTILMDQCTFSTHNTTSFWCDQSKIIITNEIVKPIPYYICSSCTQLSVDQESICTISSSTTTTGGSENNSSDAASNNPISALLLLLSFILISFINF